jgi:hypothetical protein
MKDTCHNCGKYILFDEVGMYWYHNTKQGYVYCRSWNFGDAPIAQPAGGGVVIHREQALKIPEDSREGIGEGMGRVENDIGGGPLEIGQLS